MKIITLFIVSLLVMFTASGCQVVVEKERGVITTHAMGTRIESGYTHRSGVHIANRYPSETMRAYITVFPAGKSATYQSSYPGGAVHATSPCIVLQNDTVVVTVEYYVGTTLTGTASRSFRPGNSRDYWHREWAPYKGEHRSG
ncbi:MAG: hypothetical protein Q8L64_06395 [bacterium]|nr:hypothetical protein [bacterium]